ncbi:toxin-antitoxin system YwqK family antitoxin [Marinoscillum pacificum]|uniref:toxin-antitoxin system YwqK family antitoxin n=1 Tax=Marinoscillum pacificum TaxID=392723 RepID=UPI0021585593|nr:hypothetical protein [Marinoscillum pacificum]
MEKWLIVLFLGCVACNVAPQDEIESFSIISEDSVLSFHPIETAFVINGLRNAVNSSEVTSIKFEIHSKTWSDDTLDFKKFDKDYIRDTLPIYWEGDILEETTNEPSSPKFITIYGALIVNRHGETKRTYLDSVTFVRLAEVPSKQQFGERINGDKQGVWLNYSDTHKTNIIRKEFFQNGLRHGPDSIFHDGKLLYTVNWVNGIKHGKAIKYSNGQRTQEIEFANGKYSSFMRYIDFEGNITDSVNLNSLLSSRRP